MKKDPSLSLLSMYEYTVYASIHICTSRSVSAGVFLVAIAKSLSQVLINSNITVDAESWVGTRF